MAFVINGKFTSQRITGVQRVASELTRALNARALIPGDLTLVVPRNAHTAQSTQERRRVCGWLTGNLWEQLALPLATRAEMLLSLCNTGPLFKRRHIVMIHDMAIYDTASAFTRKFRLWYRLVFSMLSMNSQHLLTVSSFSKERIVHHLGVPASRVSVIRPAVDHFERIESDSGVLARLDLQPQNYCLLVGSLDPRKNLARGLAAIDQVVCPPGFKFVLAGGSNNRVFGTMQEGDKPASQRIVPAGFVTDGELKALYENATCFVFPSLYEGFGLPPLEAMYCGCPVIASREASLPEVCGNAALYCDANSVDDIASKISLMLNDPILREMYRRRGLVQARAYGWHEAAEQLYDALASIDRAQTTAQPSA